MDVFALYTEGLPLILNVDVLFMLVVGVVGGVIIGALPGLTANMAVAVMTPLTYGISAQAAFALLLGAYCGGVYGGCITAIVARIPGTPSSMMTTLDGYPMGQRGEAGKAIGIATVSSFVGGLGSVIILSLFAPIIAEFALEFSAQEYFAIAVFGLSIIAYVSPGSMVCGILAGAIGVLLATIGADPVTGYPRFAMGSFNLMSGLELFPLLIGIFGLSEAFNAVGRHTGGVEVVKQIGRILPTWSDMKTIFPTMLRASPIGVIIGAIPAAGGTIAAIVAYGIEKRVCKNPERFGTGIMEGVAAPEAANNASTGGAMIPMLSLGIPGDSITAILIGALLIHGLQPGPLLFRDHFPVVSSIFLLMALANVLFLFVGLLGARVVGRIIATPMNLLLPIIMFLCLVGTFAIRNSHFDLGILLLFGVVGYVFAKGNMPSAPLVLGFILGPIVESNLRRGLLLSGGDFTSFFTRPLSATFMILTIAIMVSPYLTDLIRRKSKTAPDKVTTD
jgi:putative tricarboxylic transport membrane protein